MVYGCLFLDNKRNTMPKVSVIIPCYNVEQYIAECLDSVINQTFKDLEIICVEDCSTDKTKDILKQYAKKYKHITVIYNKTNQGLAVSRNIGTNKSKSKYIYFLDSDDYISKDCIEKLYDKIEHDNCDIVMGSIKVYAENNQNEFCKNYTNFMGKYLKFKPFTKLQINKKNSYEYYHKLYCCAWNKLYKKSFITDNSISFINKKCFHEDDGFWLKILACNPLISGISSKTYFYRIRSQSITSKTWENREMHMLHLKSSLTDAMNFCKKKGNKRLLRFIKSEIYITSKHRLIYFVWTKREKRIRILFLPIFSLDERKLKILGIPVYKRRKK